MSGIIDEVSVEDIAIYTGSNHKLIWAKINTSIILNYRNLQKKKKKSPTRKIFLYHKATEENQEAYSKRVEQLLKSEETNNKDPHCSKTSINEKCDLINKAIVQAATKHISWINTKKTEAQSKKSIPKCKIYKEIKLLYQIQKKKLQAHVAERINNIDQANFNSQIEEINQVYQTQIHPLPEYWSQVNINKLKNWGKVLRKKVEEEEHKNKEKEISTRIE